jgi:hypothetical protein
MKQSAVEWYAEEFSEHLEENYNIKITSLTLLAKAKQMEKQQIADAYNQSTYQFANDAELIAPKSALEYYNETFKNK